MDPNCSRRCLQTISSPLSSQPAPCKYNTADLLGCHHVLEKQAAQQPGRPPHTFPSTLQPSAPHQLQQYVQCGLPSADSVGRSACQQPGQRECWAPHPDEQCSSGGHLVIVAGILLACLLALRSLCGRCCCRCRAETHSAVRQWHAWRSAHTVESRAHADPVTLPFVSQ